MTERSRGSSRDDDRPSRGGRDEPRGRGRGDEDESPRRSSRDSSDDDRPRRSSRDEAPRRGRDDGDERPSRSSRGGSGYQYQERSSEDTRARAAAGANDFDKLLKPHIKSWKPNDGDNRIRIVPPTWKNAKHFGYDCHIHYGVGADKGAYLDLNKMLGEADPIHEEYQRAKGELDPDNKDDQEYLRQLRGTRRDLIYLIDRDHEKEGVQAWFMPFGLGNDVVKLSVDKSNGEVLPIDHPDEGYDVEFTKTGKGIGTKYSAPAIARRSSPLGKDEWLEFAMDNPLPDQLQFFDYDHIAKAFGGVGAHREKPRGRDDDDRPSRGRDDSDRGRDREDPPARGRGRSEPEPEKDELTWESIHDMTKRELKDLIEQENLKTDADDAKDVEELADWVCEDMKIEKVVRSSRRTVTHDDDDDDRLARMRSRRD